MMEMEECISNGLVDESGVLVVALHGRMGGEAEESWEKKENPDCDNPWPRIPHCDTLKQQLFKVFAKFEREREEEAIHHKIKEQHQENNKKRVVEEEDVGGLRRVKEKKNSSVSDRHYEKKDLVTRIGFSRVIRHASKIEEDPQLDPRRAKFSWEKQENWVIFTS